MEAPVAYADLLGAEDERIISYYLKTMVKDGNLWPDTFFENEDVYNTNPWQLFNYQNPNFAYVKTRTETCGRTDGCVSGCWRIMGRDKLIKSEESGKFLGFKRILKFCEWLKPRGYKGSWVMEEYRVVSKWNWKQDQVICKIRYIYEAQISFLLAKQLSHPNREVSSVPPTDDASYLHKIKESKGKYWPSYLILADNVYCVYPGNLVSVQDESLILYGSYFYVNKTDACGRTDGCYDGSCWRIIDRDRVIKSSTTGKVLGFKRILKYCEKVKPIYMIQGNQQELIWTMEEYRLVREEMKYKVLCVIKLLSPHELNYLLRR